MKKLFHTWTSLFSQLGWVPRRHLPQGLFQAARAEAGTTGGAADAGL
jgi:hypothetical protein